MTDWLHSPEGQAVIEAMAGERALHVWREQDGDSLTGFLFAWCSCGGWQNQSRDVYALRGEYIKHAETAVLRAALSCTTEKECETCGGDGLVPGYDADSGVSTGVSCESCSGTGTLSGPTVLLTRDQLEQVGWQHDDGELVPLYVGNADEWWPVFRIQDGKSG